MAHLTGKAAVLIFVVALVTLFETCKSHSILTYPQPFHPAECRIGGVSPKKCGGPCRIERLQPSPHKINYFPPNKPAAVWKRGQKVTVKYARNNHAPGGFVRLTLVPVENMMDKKIHTRNAFHFSCWGAHPKQASSNEKTRDKWGFSLVGSDGREKGVAAGYYTELITIPDVVPDGEYIFGWSWYGGVGGKVMGNVPQEPRDQSYFGDYWSCSFVEIRGGATVKKEYTPVFSNGMEQFSKEGCMAFNNKPGVCVKEPCVGKKAQYQKPEEFLGTPKPLVPGYYLNSTTLKAMSRKKGMQQGFGKWDWGPEYRKGNGNNSPSPKSGMKAKPMQTWFGWKGSKKDNDKYEDEKMDKKKAVASSAPTSTPSNNMGLSACYCLKKGTECVSKTKTCVSGWTMAEQSDECIAECCSYCRRRTSSNVCQELGIEGGCD